MVSPHHGVQGARDQRKLSAGPEFVESALLWAELAAKGQLHLNIVPIEEQLCFVYENGNFFLL